MVLVPLMLSNGSKLNMEQGDMGVMGSIEITRGVVHLQVVAKWEGSGVAGIVTYTLELLAAFFRGVVHPQVVANCNEFGVAGIITHTSELLAKFC